VSLQTQPDKRLDELMEPENERQRAKCVVTCASVTMTKDIDADRANDDPADEVCLRREAHVSNLQGIGAAQSGHPIGMLRRTCVAECFDKSRWFRDAVLSIGGMLHAVAHRKFAGSHDGGRLSTEPSIPWGQSRSVVPGGHARWWALVETESLRVVSCDLEFEVTRESAMVFQLVAADSAGLLISEKLEISGEGTTGTGMREISGAHGGRLHLYEAAIGRLNLSYRAEIDVDGIPGDRPSAAGEGSRADISSEFSEVLYRRPSRYCPTDRLLGFAISEFGDLGVGFSAVQTIVDWIRNRIEYLPGSGTFRDSAEDTLLTGKGTCRDFAHLGVALCRAIGIPARFAAVYAPGLTPMDFHAVFEAKHENRWCVFDATGLAPRSAMVRIATGRDASDAAFASVERGNAWLVSINVSAVVGASLPIDDLTQLVVLP
jgi:Transglutaminase-like superfamily